MMEQKPVWDNRLAVVDKEILQVKPLFSLSDFIKLLHRRKITALLAFLLVVALGLVLTFATKPLYRSTTHILVEGKTTSVALNDTGNPLSNLFLPAAGHDVDTQVEVLQSTDLIRKSAQSAGIDPRSVQVDVRQLGKTDVAELIVVSHSRQAAEKVAATLPLIYLRELKQNRLGEVTTGLSFAERRFQDKSGQLQRDEKALRDFKNRVGVVNLDAERAKDIEASAAAAASARQANADAAAASARLTALQATRRRLASYVSTPITVTNPEVARLRDRIASLREDRARLLFLFKPNHDAVRKVDVSIAALQRRLAVTPAETTTVTRAPNPALADLDMKIADAWAQYQAARANWSAAAGSAARVQKSLARYNAIEMKQAELQRAIDQGRNTVDMLSKSVEEMSLREKATEAANAPLQVVAFGPAEKIAPRIGRNLLVSLLLAAIVACMMAALHDALDDRIKNEEEARTFLGLPLLGRFSPAAEAPFLLSPQGDQLLMDDFRMLRTNVQFALRKCCDRALLVTSTLPDEGKTRIAANLAVAMARENWRVILVDANLHAPQLQTIFNLAAQPGFTDVLAQRCTLAEALQETTTANLRVLTAGARPREGSDWLNSPATDGVMRALNAVADYIVFDGPSCLASADAQVLASKTDGVLYVLQLGQIHRSLLLRSLELLQMVEAHVIGVALNGVPRGEGVSRATYEDTDDDDYDRYDNFEYRDSNLPAPVFKEKKEVEQEGYFDERPRAVLRKFAVLAGVVALLALAFQTLKTAAVPRLSRPNPEVLNTQESAPEARAQVLALRGNAAFWPARDNGSIEPRWQPLSTGATLPITAGIRTQSDTVLLLRLGQGGVLRIGEKTKLKLHRLGKEEYSVKVENGKVWALVKQEPAETFLQVRTPSTLFTTGSALFSVATTYNGALTMASVAKGQLTARQGKRQVIVTKSHALRVERNQPASFQAAPIKAVTRQMWHWLHHNEKWLQPATKINSTPKQPLIN